MIINKRKYLFRVTSVLGFMAFVLISGSLSCYAGRTQSLATRSAQIDKDVVFEAVEDMPTFPDGDAELMKYINAHLEYPALAKENGIKGRVVVKFVVKVDGSIGDVVVVRSKDPDLDAEAVRVVKTLPKFNPGRMNGQPVSVWFTLPINFQL